MLRRTCLSTDGQICFGVAFDEGHEFPWDDEKYSADLEDWWIEKIQGYKRPFEMFTEAGEWIGGKEWPQEKKDEYYNHKEKFVKKAPKLPVTLVNYCSGDCPMYILAVPSSYKNNNRGYAEEFDPQKLTVTPEEVAALLAFINEYVDKKKHSPKWLLTSFWG